MIKPTRARTVAEYLAQIDEPRKTDIAALHALIAGAVPDLEPSIQSGMIGYGTYHYRYDSGREGDAPIIALASQKSYISVYVCASEGGEYVAGKYRDKLPKASIGKSCIRFKSIKDVDLKALEQVVKSGARIMKKSIKAQAPGRSR